MELLFTISPLLHNGGRLLARGLKGAFTDLRIIAYILVKNFSIDLHYYEKIIAM